MKTNESEVAKDPIRDAADLLDQAAAAIVRAAGLVREARCMPPSDRPIEVRTEPEPAKVWCSVGEAARLLDLASGTISSACNRGKVRTNGAIGKDRLVDVQSLRDWARARASHPNTGRKPTRPARPGPAKPTATTRGRRANGRAARS